ncbi:MAG: hypothetical protein AAF693_12900 [Bacteroidota bacterium]
MDSIIGSIIFEIIGAFIKWVYFLAVNFFRRKKTPSFYELWMGRKEEEHANLLMQGVSNILLGLVFTISLILFLDRIL